jgi:biopolymer transport protein ExbD
MSEPRRFLDVWIIDTNTVYREVPYTVVTDWVQQGRLLESDMLKPSGTQQWSPLGSLPAFTAYLPKAEPFRAEDRAEALEPVQVEMSWKPPREDEDEDVDMIPLIDVSLVLLIFFMMTATVAGSGLIIDTPAADYAVSESANLWVGIQDRPEGPIYSVGEAQRDADPDDRQLTEAQALQHLEQKLRAGPVADVTIKADKVLPFDTVKHLTKELEKLRGRLNFKMYAEVSGRREAP